MFILLGKRAMANDCYHADLRKGSGAARSDLNWPASSDATLAAQM